MDNRRGVFDRTALMPDLVAGLTTAAVVVPSALAYATLAGLPAEVGLYAALPALVLYALLGKSRVLSVSVTSTIAILTATAISNVAPDGDVHAARQAAATLALLAGIVLVVAGALRLGGVTAFISTPVLVGFKAGMGLLIASSQLGKLLGVPFSNEGFLRNIRQAVRQLDSASGRTIVLSILTVVVLLGLRRFAPSVPGALVGVAIGIAAQILFVVEAHGVSLVDKIPSGLPSLALPTFDDAGALFPAALGIALMSSIESFSYARSVARPGDTAPRRTVSSMVPLVPEDKMTP